MPEKIMEIDLIAGPSTEEPEVNYTAVIEHDPDEEEPYFATIRYGLKERYYPCKTKNMCVAQVMATMSLWIADELREGNL